MTDSPSGPLPPAGAPSDLHELRELIRRFSGERDWLRFHTPKNLAMALSVEVAELMEHFQWLPTGADHELDDAARTGIRHEMADVLVYLIQLADHTGVDLRSAVLEKMELNRRKYPVELARGNARKYSALASPADDADEGAPDAPTRT
ncbi:MULTISPECIES: nucleotide pyrophosphohydrolase [unclassified Herbaspirillum]|uniref:nucleotide pyrophosphohydrolase n=1 Tax=unclassified Herbaspirillum TaxID=2624150 RepID=UPI001585270F|nr:MULTISPECIES: nucleotide pyrophosphohydrolase [unclassified Herbaspirillum]MCI1006522.1 nucleotide pyrophosphohydrolase [Herbaspirillum sp. C7C8]NUT62438.1 nucleotide pyrophosphohydrolase [Herbaspirillum sp. C9C3]